MVRWPAVLLLTATGLAAQQAPDAPRDSSHLARVLTLLKTSDSTVCELAAQAISNSWDFSGEPRRLPTPMQMPMPTPMPMPMAMHIGNRPHVRVHVHRGPHWYGEEAGGLGAFRAVLRDDNRCVRNVAARVLGRARSPESYDAFLALLRDPNPGLRETGALGLGELDDRRALRPLQDALRDRDAAVRAMAARGVGEIEDSSSVGALTTALGDDAAPVRQTAAWALGQLATTQAAFGEVLRSPIAADLMGKARERGLETASEFELNLGRAVAELT